MGNSWRAITPDGRLPCSNGAPQKVQRGKRKKGETTLTTALFFIVSGSLHSTSSSSNLLRPGARETGKTDF